MAILAFSLISSRSGPIPTTVEIAARIQARNSVTGRCPTGSGDQIRRKRIRRSCDLGEQAYLTTRASDIGNEHADGAFEQTGQAISHRPGVIDIVARWQQFISAARQPLPASAIPGSSPRGIPATRSAAFCIFVGQFTDVLHHERVPRRPLWRARSAITVVGHALRTCWSPCPINSTCWILPSIRVETDTDP